MFKFIQKHHDPKLLKIDTKQEYLTRFLLNKKHNYVKVNYLQEAIKDKYDKIH